MWLTVMMCFGGFLGTMLVLRETGVYHVNAGRCADCDDLYLEIGLGPANDPELPDTTPKHLEAM